MQPETVLFPSLYEEDYILRSLGNNLLNQPDIALTELVANAWDAGASQVTISIPEHYGDVLSVEDNGMGMTAEEFQSRWMKLRYNRLKGQGKKVLFPDENESNGNRYAFGRNGIGRHALFCFGNEYKVVTTRNGKKLTLKVKPNVNSQPFAVTEKQEEDCTGHGTRLEVIVNKNLPKPEKIVEILSARFLLDPQFQITVNHTTLELDDLTGDIAPTEIKIKDTDILLTAYFIDTSKASKKSIFQGIAFWQSGRLVGEPTWSLGKNMVLDGRTSLAKRYTFVIKSNDLAEYIKEDWSGFKESETMEKVYKEVSDFVESCFHTITSSMTALIKENLDTNVKKSLHEVNPLVRKEVDHVISEIVNSNPKVKQESVDLVVQTIINLEKSKNGHELLEKLSTLKPDDIDGLNKLLSKWTINDALVVLNEIDRRLSIITAIRKLSSEKTTDELHVLHPMIAESRWLFGPEYESSEYIFNRQMKTAAIKIFGKDAFINEDTNYKKRPDLICLQNSSISITGIEDVPVNIGLATVRKLLLIELKRGGFEITRNERNQAQGYIEDLLNSNLGNSCQITAFVVGDSVATNITPFVNVGESNLLYVTTYSQLVDTAERRMFGLRQILASRYDDVPGMELYAQAKLF